MARLATVRAALDRAGGAARSAPAAGPAAGRHGPGARPDAGRRRSRRRCAGSWRTGERAPGGHVRRRAARGGVHGHPGRAGLRARRPADARPDRLRRVLAAAPRRARRGRPRGRARACCATRLAEHVAAHGTAPIIVVVPRPRPVRRRRHAGRRPTRPATSTSMPCASARAPSASAACAPLSDAERRFIEAWEAEAYRRDVAAGAGRRRPLRGQGGARHRAPPRASGWPSPPTSSPRAATSSWPTSTRRSRSRTPRDLEARHGPGRATAVAMNVMDEQSVADGFHATVARYGGLDLLVSNAGVLRAGRGDEPAAGRVRPRHAGQLPRLLPGRPVRGPDHGPPARGAARPPERHHRDQLQVRPGRLQPQQRLRRLASSAASG